MLSFELNILLLYVEDLTYDPFSRIYQSIINTNQLSMWISKYALLPHVAKDGAYRVLGEQRVPRVGRDQLVVVGAVHRPQVTGARGGGTEAGGQVLLVPVQGAQVSCVCG